MPRGNTAARKVAAGMDHSDLEEDKNLSNATLDDYLLANNKVIDKEISSIETTLT